MLIQFYFPDNLWIWATFLIFWVIWSCCTMNYHCIYFVHFPFGLFHTFFSICRSTFYILSSNFTSIIWISITLARSIIYLLTDTQYLLLLKSQSICIFNERIQSVHIYCHYWAVWSYSFHFLLCLLLILPKYISFLLLVFVGLIK